MRLAGWFSGFALALALLAPGAPTWAQSGPSPVAVSQVIEHQIAPTQSYVGTIVPKRRAVVGSAVDGRVSEFKVRQGQRVEANEALAQLLTETIKLDLEAAQEDLALRQAELDELRNGERREVVNQTKARREAAEAALQYATQRLERMTRLFQQGKAVSRDELEQTRSVKTAAEELLRQRASELEEVVVGPRPERIAQAEARFRTQEANVKKLEDQIKKHTVITRFSGYVVTEHTEEGQWVKRGDPVAEVVALDKVEHRGLCLRVACSFRQCGRQGRSHGPGSGNEDVPG